jgi:hypothetical protein
MTADTVTAVCAVVQTLLLALGGSYALKQVAEARHARHVALFLPLYQELNSHASVNTRRKLYVEIGPKGAASSPEERDVVNDIVNQFDLLGYLVRIKAIERDTVLGFYYGTIIRCWQEALWYIDEQRRLRSTKFAEHFEWLAGMARSYTDKHYPGTIVDNYARRSPVETPGTQPEKNKLTSRLFTDGMRECAA